MTYLRGGSISNYTLAIKEMQHGSWETEEIAIRANIVIDGSFAIITSYDEKDQFEQLLVIPADCLVAISYNHKNAKVIKLNSDEGPEDENEFRA
jgi:hypothetical protein